MPIIMTGSISFTYHLIPERKKTIWTLLGSNPGRLRGKRPLYPLLHGSRAGSKGAEDDAEISRITGCGSCWQDFLKVRLVTHRPPI